MKMFYFFLCLILLVGSGFGQNWYPLEVGNKSLSRYQYYYQGGTFADFYFITVQKDTLIDGKRFFWVSNYSDRDGLYENYWLRYDQNDQKIYLWANDTSVIYMDFNLNAGEQFPFYNPVTGITTYRTVYESTANYFGESRNVKGFNVNWYPISTWIDSVGVKPYGSLIQVLQVRDSDTIYFEYGYEPDFSYFEPLYYTDTLNFNFDFWVGHKYSNPFPPRPKDFLDEVYFDGFYASQTDTISAQTLYASTLTYLKKRIYIQLNPNLINNGYSFYYKITAKDKGLIPKYGSKPDTDFYHLAIITTSVSDGSYLVSSYKLFQNYPNPFNPSTVIGYQLPVSGDVALKVYDVLGREVAVLVDEFKEAGYHEVEFNPESSITHPASGVYFYQLFATGLAGSFIEAKKMIYLK